MVGSTMFEDLWALASKLLHIALCTELKLRWPKDLLPASGLSCVVLCLGGRFNGSLSMLACLRTVSLPFRICLTRFVLTNNSLYPWGGWRPGLFRTINALWVRFRPSLRKTGSVF